MPFNWIADSVKKGNKGCSFVIYIYIYQECSEWLGVPWPSCSSSPSCHFHCARCSMRRRGLGTPGWFWAWVWPSSSPFRSARGSSYAAVATQTLYSTVGIQFYDFIHYKTYGDIIINVTQIAKVHVILVRSFPVMCLFYLDWGSMSITLYFNIILYFKMNVFDFCRYHCKCMSCKCQNVLCLSFSDELVHVQQYDRSDYCPRVRRHPLGVHDVLSEGMILHRLLLAIRCNSEVLTYIYFSTTCMFTA